MTTYTADMRRDLIARAHAHVEDDRLVARQYNAGGSRGCSIGCHAMDLGVAPGDHAALAEALGWPVWLLYVEDCVFEGLAADRRAWFHCALAEAVPVGADVERAKWRWLAWLVGTGATQYTAERSAQREACETVAALCVRAAAGDMAGYDEWFAARTAAEDAAMAAWGTAAGTVAKAAWATATWPTAVDAASWAAAWAASADGAAQDARAAAWYRIAVALIDAITQEAS